MIAFGECKCVLIQPGGVKLRKDVREGRGSKEKQENADKGGEGVKNPGNFADVLYVWSLRRKYERTTDERANSSGYR